METGPPRSSLSFLLGLTRSWRGVNEFVCVCGAVIGSGDSETLHAESSVAGEYTTGDAVNFCWYSTSIYISLIFPVIDIAYNFCLSV